MTTLSQEQETQPHPLTSTPPKGPRRPSQPSLLSRQCSEQLDQPHQPLQPLQPNQHHHGHYHRRPSALGSFSQSRDRPSMTSQSSFCGQRPPGSGVFGHFRSHQQPQQQQHHHHHSHPRLSQKNRQKLFSRSRGYKSVCSGSGSQHGTCPGRSRCTADTTASMSRDHHDEDIEACPYHPWPEEPSSVISERCTRARINSAIFVSSEGRGFDSIEFIRRYGSQSVLCRKARSAENVSASERQRRFSEYPEWESEENKQYGKMNGYEHCGPDGASNTNAEPRQDSIELVECHREPGSSTTANQPVTVTPAVVVLPLPVGGSSSKCCASASGGCNGSSSGAGDYVCLDGHHSKTTPKLSNLPTLSVSGPSPPHEEEFFQYSPPLENGPEKERY
ncbi:uncharacterized protein LOC6035628 isoform X8 [Culex quinquefasciatus]|uniref:uncharacterized protein LOC6035628 isoform X8 n=1 Tax=Culex quinquefasciatus TaxID=7176 RepID=UPI0018E35876|nr:uncharacterized protein LOC6035628 isoform X8 [Culex quinquefasciatus]